MNQICPVCDKRGLGPLPTSIVLRDYQQDAVKQLTIKSETQNNLALAEPTGSGKTIIIHSFIACTFGDDAKVEPFRAVLIAAPQKVIRDEFLDPGGRPIDTGSPYGTVHSCKTRLADSGDFQYLIMSPDGHECVFTACHQSIVSWTEILEKEMVVNPVCATGKLLVVDEAHHSAADGLSYFISLWESSGGSVLRGTGTPIRHDTRDVFPPDSFKVQRTLSQQMIDGYAPARIECAIIDIGGDGYSDSQIEGQPQDVLRGAMEMVQHWVHDGMPKTIVRVRHHGAMVISDSGVLMNKYIIDQVAAEFERAGARVYRAYGEVDEDETLTEMLAAEKKKKCPYGRIHFDDSQYDVIIGINRVTEGMDWPLCSHVYMWGIPKSLPSTAQAIGRATRDRKQISGYPNEWVDRTKIVIFVSGVKDPEKRHSKQTLLISCFLASYDTMHQASILHEIHGLIRDFKYANVEQQAQDREETSKLIVTDDVRAIVMDWMNIAWMRLPHGEYDKRATLRDLLKETRSVVSAARVSGDPDAQRISDETARRVVVDLWMAGRRKELDAYRKHLEQFRADGISLSEAHRKAFEQIVQDFQDETVDKMPCLDSVTQLLGVNGELMNTYADRLQSITPNLDKERIWQSILEFRRRSRTGAWPTAQDGVDPIYPQECFSDYHRAMVNGRRGLRVYPGGIAGFVHETIMCNPELQYDWVEHFLRIVEMEQRWNKDGTSEEISRRIAGCRTREQYIQRTFNRVNVEGAHVFYFYPNAIRALKMLGAEVARELGIVRCAWFGGQNIPKQHRNRVISAVIQDPSKLESIVSTIVQSPANNAANP